MSDTPRTDANCWDTIAGAVLCKPTTEHAYVPASLARQLERENAALQNEIDELKRLNELTKVLTKDLQDTRRENTALKQTLIEVTTELTAIKCKK